MICLNIMAPDFGRLLCNGEILSESVCECKCERGRWERNIIIVNIIANWTSE